MKYTVEIDSSSKEGSDAIKFLRKLKDDKSVAIHRWKKLTPRDVALPGGLKPTEWQWEEYLNREQGKGRPAEEVFADLKKKLNRKFGK
ncbi:MAG: hypothetical protein RLZZ367_202 [Bacteroidota bacterium]|jgi:hypothetical protein